MKFLRLFIIMAGFICLASCWTNENKNNRDSGTREEPAATGNSTDSGIHGTATKRNYSDSINPTRTKAGTAGTGSSAGTVTTDSTQH